MGLDILICVNDIPNSNLSQMVSNVEVQERMDQNTSYKLDFMVDVCDGDISSTVEPLLDINSILSIFTTVNDSLECLVKGPVTRHNVNLQHGGAGSSLHVEGEDTGQLMNRRTNIRVTSALSDADIARNIISANDNTIPDVAETSSDRYEEDGRSHVQNETDLALLRTLARRNGFHFWLTYNREGVATGHFMARSLSGEPTAVLKINHEDNNIDALQINADPQAPSETIGRQIDQSTNEVFGDTVTLDDEVLGESSLTGISGTAQAIQLSPMVETSAGLQARSRAALAEAQWFINASCHTSLHKLCKTVRVHTVVKMEGAGSRHSGKYYVTAVKHSINAATYNMDLELARNAWGNQSSGANGLISNIF